MSTIHKDALTAKVVARNKVNAEAMRLSLCALELFRPLLGQKVCSVNGGLLKKYEHLKPTGNTPDDGTWPSGTFSVTFENRYKSFGFYVRTVESSNGRTPDYQIASYADAHFQVGELDDCGFMMKLAEPYKARTDYTVDAIRAIREERDEAERKMRHLDGELSEFGRYDN